MENAKISMNMLMLALASSLLVQRFSAIDGKAGRYISVDMGAKALKNAR